MTTLERAAQEIVDLHDFFTAWFNGTVERNQLEPQFLSRLDENVIFIPPEGVVMTRDMLKAGFDCGYGSNPHFRIQIRDVTIRHEIGDIVLATYTEWQSGATQSATDNARITSVLMKMGTPMTGCTYKRCGCQETWLPKAVRDAGASHL